MKKYNALYKIVSFVLIVSILTSCSHYKLTTYEVMDADEQRRVSKKVNDDGWRQVIFHNGDEMWEVHNVKVGVAKDSCKGVLKQVDPKLISAFEFAEVNNDDGKIKVNLQKRYALQTHLYMDSMSLKEHDEIKIAIRDVTKAKILGPSSSGNVAAVAAVFGLVVVGLIVGTVALVLISCNCPHAYTFDGKSYHYTNTLFTGATAANLERFDYKILPDYRPESDSYEMIIKNEQNESQYTNVLELLVVNHAADVEVVPDQNGNLHPVSKLELANSVTDDNGTDLSPQLSFRDDNGYAFDNNSDENEMNSYLSFGKPDDVANAKLVLNIKNDKWGGVVSEAFATMMGDKYEGWIEKKSKRTPEEAKAGMKKAGVPLLVSIKKDGKWVDVDVVEPVGDVGYQTLVVPVDARLISGENIEIRLQSGFKFWDLDYVAMDFTPKTDFDVETIKPTTAEGTSDYLAALANDDDLYMEHKLEGDSAHIVFEGLKSTGEKRTVIMRSKGHYISNKEYTGTPFYAELLKIKVAGGLSKFSKKLYAELQKQELLQAATE